MKPEELPSGWDEHDIQEIVEYYDNQTDEEAAAEHEAALSSPASTLMEVPTELVPIFRDLIARHRLGRRTRK
jgi:hypothetical protein